MKKSFLVLGLFLAVALVAAGPTFAADPAPLATPADTHDVVMEELENGGHSTYIVDVRTPEEYAWVGHPGANKIGEGTVVDADGNVVATLDDRVVNISFMIVKKGAFIKNPSFLSEVNELFGDVKDSVVLVTMCRSGGRANAAALALIAEGYEVYNMEHGFSGGKDEKGYRTVNGWVNDGLTYKITKPGTAGAYAD